MHQAQARQEVCASKMNNLDGTSVGLCDIYAAECSTFRHYAGVGVGVSDEPINGNLEVFCFQRVKQHPFSFCRYPLDLDLDFRTVAVE